MVDVGDKAPDAQFALANGRTASAADFAGQKLVLSGALGPDSERPWMRSRA